MGCASTLRHDDGLNEVTCDMFYGGRILCREGRVVSTEVILRIFTTGLGST
jgi:hypothetical protein